MAFSSSSLLCHRWLEHARARPQAEAIVHWSAGQAPFRWTWSALLTLAQDFAARLRDRGVRPGQVCSLIIRQQPDLYPLYLGVSLLGAIPAVLAYPNPRIHPDKYRQGLEGMAKVSGLDWLLTEADLVDVIRPVTAVPGTTVRGILCPFAAENVCTPPARRWSPAQLQRVDPNSPCLLQHSSGTTGLQKAVVLSHRAVLDHLDRYAQAIALGPNDKVVSWLPLYHDMGLIAAFHLSLSFGLTLVQLDPFEWARLPYLLLQAISQEQGTLTWLPNFAYNLMADRIHEDDIQDVRLDSLRLAINCSEPVRADSHERFLKRFASSGLQPQALAARYAMAETTFAVTQTPPGVAPRTVLANRAELSRGRYRPGRGDEGPQVRACVSSGRPISGCQVRVVGEDGNDLPEGHVGEVLVRSVSLFDGYRNQPHKTAEVFRDGWYRSGDLGFRLGEDWFVIGRKKDLIIVAGKNLCPEDIEDAVNTVAGVIPGRVVAFGVENAEKGTEEVHVVAETDIRDEKGRLELILAVQRAAMEVDVTISRVVLVPPRWLIKSSSGKLSRSANKDRLAEYQAVADTREWVVAG